MKYPEAESNRLEFKRESPKNNQIVKTIIGFCNTYGGKLIIGVDDTNEIIGLDETTIESLKTSVEKKLFDAAEPSIIANVYIQTLHNKSLLVIEVSEGMNKPYYIRTDGREKGTYIRLGSHTQLATPNIVQELIWQSKNIDFENLPIHQATIDDLDNEKINLFLNQRKQAAPTLINNELLHSYGIISYDHSKLYPTNLGILLFGRNPQKFLSEAIIICSHFKGDTGRETLATLDCEGDLFLQLETAFNFIVKNLSTAFSMKELKDKLKREDQLEIPAIAIREVLLNMIVHRNYHIKAPSKIAIYENRIEFYSPGQFPGPLSTDNLQQGITYLRNPKICKIFREAGLIEKLGSGFITLFESFQTANLETPQVINGENFVKCILPRTKKSSIEIITDEMKILNLFLQQPKITVMDIIRLLSVSRATAVRKLNVLLESKKIQRHGKAKGSYYTVVKS